MTVITNDYHAIAVARSYKYGLRRGAALAALPCVMLGIAIMLAVHLGLSMYSDRLHDETVRLLTVERDRLKAEVAGLSTGYTAGWAASEENRLEERR